MSAQMKACLMKYEAQMISCQLLSNSALLLLQVFHMCIYVFVCEEEWYKLYFSYYITLQWPSVFASHLYFICLEAHIFQKLENIR